MELVMGPVFPLIGKIGKLISQEYNLEKRLQKDLISMKKQLDFIYAALAKVAEKPPDQLTNKEQVLVWAGHVRELSYDMEDAVDVLQVQLDDEDLDADPSNIKGRVKKLLKKTTRLLTKGKTIHQISDTIHGIHDRASELYEFRKRYKLDMHDTNLGPANIDPRLLNAQYKDILVGIQESRDELIHRISEGDKRPNPQFQTVSIVGCGGLGKSTLAIEIFERIQNNFECGAFVVVSRNPTMKKVFMDILYELDQDKFGDIHGKTGMDENKLIKEIQKILMNKRYLIVFDDIWEEKNWDLIKHALLPTINVSSRVMTTTRNVSVSQACHLLNNGIIHRMKPLSDKDSRLLFNKRIFGSDSGCPDELEEVSRDILKKCGGVPLAIITISSLLACSNQQIRPVDKWYDLLDKIGRGLTDGNMVDEMKRILSISYYDLPSVLKTCLLYLSIFPEDHVIDRDRLIWRWIAEGIIVPDKKQEHRLFEIGVSYFNELVNRSLIQPVINGVGITEACRVHDMVLELICSLSREGNFVTIIDRNEHEKSYPENKVRRLSIQDRSKEELIIPQLTARSLSQVRSVTIFGISTGPLPPLSYSQVLRVLDLQDCFLMSDSCKIDLSYLENLLHLRYLGLRNTYITELPREIGKLRLLQILDLKGANLNDLPKTVCRLRNLIRLCIDEDTKVQDGLGNLVSLEELRTLSVDEFSHDVVKELRHLTKLRVLVIAWNEMDESLSEALVEALGSMHKLESLEIVGYGGHIDLMREGWMPPPRLRRFMVESCAEEKSAFLTLPKWINSSSLPMLSCLEIGLAQVRQEDIHILGMLPYLDSLNVLANGDMTEHTVERFMITNGTFLCITRCAFRRFVTLPSMFQRGSMPRLRSILFSFEPWHIADNELELHLSMCHLPCLEHVNVHLFCTGASVAKVEQVCAALNLAASEHPNRPSLDIRKYGFREEKKIQPEEYLFDFDAEDDHHE